MERRSSTFQSLRTNCSPTPSMSIAAPTQWISVSSPRDGQPRFGHRCITSPSGLTTGVSQSGHRSGMRNGFEPRRVWQDRADHLWDHVAGPLDDDDVAFADVLAVDVLLVVERRGRDRDAADRYGLQLRPRVERARAADADMDPLQRRLRPVGRPLEGFGPARPFMKRPEPGLLVERVDLDHDAVDLVVELCPRPLPRIHRLGNRLDRLVPLDPADSCGSRARAAIRAPRIASPRRVPPGNRARRPRWRAPAGR